MKNTTNDISKVVLCKGEKKDFFIIKEKWLNNLMVVTGIVVVVASIINLVCVIIVSIK